MEKCNKIYFEQKFIFENIYIDKKRVLEELIYNISLAQELSFQVSEERKSYDDFRVKIEKVSKTCKSSLYLNSNIIKITDQLYEILHQALLRSLLYIKQASLTKSEEVKYELFKKYISDLKNLYKNQGYATLFLQLKNALKDEIYI